MKLKLETYTPSEAAEISGLGLELQRNWRRRGYLPKNKGHGRYTLSDLAVFAVMAQLSERGIGPNVSQTFAEEAKRAIFLHSLTMNVFEREALNAAYDLHRRQIDADVAAAAAAAARSRGTEDPEAIRSILIDLVRQKLADQVQSDQGMRGAQAPGYLVIWADGSTEFVADDEDPFASGDHWFADPRRQGGVLIFPLAAIAYKLVTRLPRPAITFAEATP